MRRKDILIIVAVLVIITFIAVFSMYYMINDGNIFLKREEKVEDMAETKKEYHSNGWETAIVDKIIHDIPIPVGFTYIEGKKDTGIIIQDNETKAKYMWIPEQEIDEDIYEKIASEGNLENTKEESIKSIKKYGGFYVEMVEEGAEGQGIRPSIQHIDEELAKTETHELTQEEKMLVEQMSKNIGIDINTENINAMTLSTGTEEEKIEEISEDKLATKVKDKNGDIAYIPKGFSYKEGTVKTGLKIRDGINLSFIWIPVEDIEQVRTEIKGIMERNIDEAYIVSGSDENSGYEELKKSIEIYGGFYISEAELGYDENGNKTNQYRRMTKYGDDITNANYVSNGDYYRNVKEDNLYSEDTVVGQKQRAFNEENKTLYEKAIEKCANLYSDSETVVSHLTYGLEYDAAILYLLKNNDEVTEETAFGDSSNIGKYYNSTDKEKLWYTEYSLNGIYGLAGNLAEITQEKDGENIVIRGGSYNTTGNAQPLASKTSSEEKQIDLDGEGNKVDTVGFRACIYIKTEYTTELWKDVAADSFAGGEGTEENPYIIETAEQLAYLAKIVNEGDTCEGKYYKITKDIDLTGRKWTPIGETEGSVLYGSTYVAKFQGILDGEKGEGENHKIIGIDVREEYNAGLIGTLSGQGQVKNITIESGTIKAHRSYAGGIAGCMSGDSQITGCTNEGNVTAGDYDAGGIAGILGDNVIVENSTNKGEVVAGVECAGGIVGWAGYSDVDNENYQVTGCTNEGKVAAEKWFGDIIGYDERTGRSEGNNEESEEIATEIKIGDYVYYVPGQANGYQANATYSGITMTKLTGQESLRWRVLNINSDGTIDLISTTPTNSTLAIKGAKGYNNGVYLLNDICKSLYSNEQIGATARSINMDDIKSKIKSDFDYNYRLRINNKTQYGEERTLNSLNCKVPYRYASYLQGNEPTNSNGIDKGFEQVTLTGKVKSTFLLLKKEDNLYNNTIYNELFFSGNYFLASCYEYYFGANKIEFGLQIATNYEIAGWALCFEDGIEQVSEFGIRPIVNLPASAINTEAGNNGGWQLK